MPVDTLAGVRGQRLIRRKWGVAAALGRIGIVAAALGLMVSSSACSDESGAPVAQHSEPYALLRASGWALQEAVDPPPDDPVATTEHPPLAWYAEYVSSTSGGTRMVRLSGHDGPIALARRELTARGFTFVAGTIADRQALRMSSSADPAGPSVVVLANGETTFMLLSYDVRGAELENLAARVDVVDRAAWIAAGGKVT